MNNLPCISKPTDLLILIFCDGIMSNWMGISAFFLDALVFPKSQMKIL